MTLPRSFDMLLLKYNTAVQRRRKHFHVDGLIDPEYRLWTLT